jgi:hypothetical protein
MLKIPNLGTNVERAATTCWPASGWNRLESSDILRNSLPSDRHGCRAGFELPITMIELYYDLNPFLNPPETDIIVQGKSACFECVKGCSISGSDPLMASRAPLTLPNWEGSLFRYVHRIYTGTGYNMNFLEGTHLHSPRNSNIRQRAPKVPHSL